MCKKLLLLSFLFVNTELYAQEKSTIQTDRPDQTESPFITPKRQLQMEIGFVYEKESKSVTNYTHPNILTKFGLSDRVELRLVTDYGSNQQSYSDVVTTKSLFSPTLVGCKVNFFEEKGIVPQTSMILHVGIPFLASKTFQRDEVFTTFRFLMQHSLGDKTSLSYNLGAEWDGITTKPTVIYTLAAGYSISSRLGSYIELYGFAQGRQVTHQYDMGFTYLITPDLQLDASGGVGINKNAPDYFVGIGISFRTGS
jgi:hypothetical protein